eukprot:SAG22_NODE_6338_length_868_cov_2.635891_2_plen_48_part_01
MESVACGRPLVVPILAATGAGGNSGAGAGGGGGAAPGGGRWCGHGSGG